jgi:hypothetical protein
MVIVNRNFDTFDCNLDKKISGFESKIIQIIPRL